jgi:hypothetical protein
MKSFLWGIFVLLVGLLWSGLFYLLFTALKDMP